MQGAEHELGQAALALVDDNWAKVLGDTSTEAQAYLQENVESIKNVTEVERANSADGLENIASNEENLAFYQENIHGSEQTSINDVLNTEIETAINETVKTLEVLQEQVPGV